MLYRTKYSLCPRTNKVLAQVGQTAGRGEGALLDGAILVRPLDDLVARVAGEGVARPYRLERAVELEQVRAGEFVSCSGRIGLACQARAAK